MDEKYKVDLAKTLGKMTEIFEGIRDIRRDLGDVDVGMEKKMEKILSTFERYESAIFKAVFTFAAIVILLDMFYWRPF